MESKYDMMSDEELSSEVMVAIYGKIVKHFSQSHCGKYLYDCGISGDQFYTIDIIDINNPADMWPIIVENDISLINDMSGNIGAAHDDYQQVWLPKDKALRAAAIVFLTIKDGGNE
jgi:hypothetical protein